MNTTVVDSWDIDAKCDVCGEEMPQPVVNECPSCKKAVCEGCEVQHCEHGFHACPLCGAHVATCSGVSSDSLRLMTVKHLESKKDS